MEPEWKPILEMVWSYSAPLGAPGDIVLQMGMKVFRALGDQSLHFPLRGCCVHSPLWLARAALPAATGWSSDSASSLLFRWFSQECLHQCSEKLGGQVCLASVPKERLSLSPSPNLAHTQKGQLLRHFIYITMLL